VLVTNSGRSQEGVTLLPVMISMMITPKENTSGFIDILVPVIFSGAIYPLDG
jgi:hypothetical protein